jgi:hypothetical protein
MNALKVTETDRNSQMYVYVPPSPHSSSPPPLAPCSASSLNFFSSAIHSSREHFMLFCFVFSCVRLRRRSEGHTPLLTTQLKIFLCEENLHNNDAKENKKILKIGNKRAKEHKKVVKICAH